MALSHLENSNSSVASRVLASSGIPGLFQRSIMAPVYLHFIPSTVVLLGLTNTIKRRRRPAIPCPNIYA